MLMLVIIEVIMTQTDSESLIYPRNSHPFGKSWEKWAENWCKWLLSIPKDKNPANDDTGRNCAENQTDDNVWFLAGTFGNRIPIRRKCTVPKSKSILFAILEKEDSFKEDIDLKREQELAIRAKNEMDSVIYLDAFVDGMRLLNLGDYRARSEVFDLNFPENSVYPVSPGWTRSVCDGYWIFLKPLPLGSHEIKFIGEVLLRNDVVANQMMNYPIYRPFAEEINKNFTFKIEVAYDILIK